LVHPSATTCFSTIPPNYDIQQLTTRALLSRNFVQAMRKEFGLRHH
jgi:hypothetical protein